MARKKHHEPWFGVDDLGECWELAWDTSLGQRGYNKNGVSGWCKIISRSSGDPIEPGLPRVHLCYHNPCEARWKHETKYGPIGFPMHVQLAEDWRRLGPLATPAPVPPPAAAHSRSVEAPLGPGEGADRVAETNALFCFSPPEETPQDTALADAAWIQQGIEEEISAHIAEYDWTHVRQ